MKKLTVLKSALAVMAVAGAFIAPEVLAETSDTLVEKLTFVDKTLQALKTFFVSLAGAGGLYLFLKGFWMMYKHTNNPNQELGQKGLVAVIIGSILMAGVYVIAISQNTLGVDQGEQTSNIDSTFE